MALSSTFSYAWSKGKRDLLAGLTVAAISLPQGMAYALIAGVDPRFGLYSAMVVTLVASLLGSSSHLINGPTSAISLVVFSALAFLDPNDTANLYEAMFLLGVMVGIVQIGIAVFRLGDLTRYISESVILGFMAGAAVLLAIGQIGNALGVREKGSGHQHVLYRLWLTLTGDPVNLKAAAVSVASVVLALLLRRAVRRYRLPQIDMFVVLIIVSGAAYVLGWTRLEQGGHTAVAVIGTLKSGLPSPHIPEIHWNWIGQLSSSAVAIASLGLLEALSIAKSIAHHTRQPLDYNRQCLAEGVANLVGGFFRCLPGSGSLSRSAINYQAGAATRCSGVVTAVTVALAVLALAPLTRYIPKAALAGLLFVTAVRLIDVERLRYTFRASKYDAGLIVLTMMAALLIGVEFSILIGVAVSILLFVPRAAKLRATELVVSPEGVVRERLPSDPSCGAVAVWDFEGEFFFGAAPELDRHLEAIRTGALQQGVRYVVLRLKRVRNPDVVCIERLEHFLRDAQRDGLVILLAGLRPALRQALGNLHFSEWYPAERFFPEEDETWSATVRAVRYAYTQLGERNTCAHCTERFHAERSVDDLYYLV
ncbi:SulP family inorganic anion transporter [Paraburkholderia sp. UYCP14C]|uniref:SulP family inorganic anion transporter n=1 Tax=Paraburkholderia sp. UYCP14C TaxID=2511130 RepID=UPI00101F044C|nr:SulP family inorganic anion transporter [Paraburkholderia sp. UYCP14C]RZF27353.1 SulP family inorganic anion transporter [Paraburkholderia sp. UYCP14C]